MDFSSILKGATSTLKKLETDVAKAGKEMTSNPASWNGWDTGGEDDVWEDVADVAVDGTTVVKLPPPPDPSAAPSAAPRTASPAKPSIAERKCISSPSDAKKGLPHIGKGDNGSIAVESAESEMQNAKQEAIVDSVTDVNGSNDGSILLNDLQEKLKEALDRASASERKVYAISRDRDALRRIRDSRNSDAELVKEKDKQIEAILSEGQTLSVKIAEKEHVVRNLKASLKERDSMVEDLQVTISATEAKLEAAASRQRQLETSEKAAQDAMEAVERRLRQVESDARSKSSSSAALEAARAQLESLRKGQAAALENQGMRLRAEYESAIEQVSAKAKIQEDSLNKAMIELRAHLTQVVDNAGWREDQLRKETEELRKRAEQLEARNEELAAALPGATRPLLRQVEALQAAASERVRAKSAVEKSQMDRLRAAEAAAAIATEREKAAEERIGKMMTRIASLEEQVKIAHAEHTRVGAELRALQAENAEEQLKHQRELEQYQAQALKANREKESAVEDLSKERASHLDAIEGAEDKERHLRGQIAVLETKLEMVNETLAKTTTTHVSRGNMLSVSQTSTGMVRFDSAGNVSASSFGLGGSEYGDESAGLGEGASPSAGVYATERLNSSLRQRHGEIASLQSQLDSKEAATQALAEEVISLTSRVDELTKEVGDAPDMKKELSGLKKRHAALLELLGEREERIMELQADLADVNQMYKEQVTELLLRIEKLSS